jgi:hypothetical protein
MVGIYNEDADITFYVTHILIFGISTNKYAE